MDGDDVTKLERGLGRRRAVRVSTRALVHAVLAIVLGAGVLGLASGCGGQAPQSAPAPTCTLPDPRPTLVPSSVVLPAHPSVLIVGDSYTEGYGGEPKTMGWAYLVGQPLGWQVTVNGVGGTGYVNPGLKNEGTYLQRLPKLQGRSFDLVVVQGGSNDTDTSYPVLLDAVTRTIDAVRAEFPGAAVVVLGPATPYGKSDGTRIVMQCVLSVYTAQQNLPFLDPISENWFVSGDGKRYANPVNGHPNNAGYAHIAARFETDVHLLLGTTKRA